MASVLLKFIAVLSFLGVSIFPGLQQPLSASLVTWDFGSSNNDVTNIVTGYITFFGDGPGFEVGGTVTYDSPPAIESFSFTNGSTVWNESDSLGNFAVEFGTSLLPADLAFFDLAITDHSSGDILTIGGDANGSLRVAVAKGSPEEAASKSDSGTFSSGTVPEPGTFTLFAGLLGCAWWIRRKRKDLSSH